jgi:hypothetical protein
MTPDEVVNTIESIKKEISLINSYFEDCMEVVLHKNDIKLPPITIEALQSAITQIQDYQKLRERVSVERINKIIDDVMPCSCISAYKDRGLTAPDCANHNYKEDLSEQIVTYLQQPTEH